MPVDAEPRLLRAGEFEELMDLLDRSFAYERGGLAARYPFAYDREHPEHHAVVSVDGSIVSHAACIPEDLVVDEETRVPCAGIGGVATAKPHRGQGYMSQLLAFWLDWMDDEGILLAELGGDRTRYGHFGWELSGSRVVYRLTERSMGSLPAGEQVTLYDGSRDDLAALQHIHRQHVPRLHRDERTAAAIFGQRGMETLLYRQADDPTAYVCLSRENRSRSIKEFGGDPDGIKAILGWCMTWWDVDRFTVDVHPRDPRNELFAQLAAGWQTKPARMVNVRNLPTLLRTYEESLSDCVRDSAWAEARTVTLGIDDEERSARLEVGADALTVSSTDAPPTITLTRRSAARLLFGGPGRMMSTKSQYPVLDVLFPLAFHLWPSERV